MSVQIRESYEPVSEEDLRTVERMVGVELPLGYRQFLIEHNGGYPVPDVFVLLTGRREMIDRFLGIHDGEHDSLLKYCEAYRERLPADLVPVAHDAGGNLVCIGVAGERKGQVFFWDHELEAEEGETPSYDNVYLVASSFDSFLGMLHELDET